MIYTYFESDGLNTINIPKYTKYHLHKHDKAEHNRKHIGLGHLLHWKIVKK